MATITKRNKGWRAQIRKKGINKSAQFRTKAEAQQWAYYEEQKILTGEYDVADIPLSFVVEQYIREVSITKRGYRNEKIRLLAFCDLPIAKISLQNLNERHFQQWRDERLKTVSAATVLREWNTLTAMLNHAIREWKYLKENPMKNVKKPPTPKARTRRYSDSEINALIYSSGFREQSPPDTATKRVGIGILFAIETAMRQGEICALTWENVDFSRRLAHLPMTKNGYSRDVPLSTRAVELLYKLQEVQSENDPSVFQVTSKNFEAIFRKLRDRCNIENLHFHDTRREALTRLAKKVDVMTLAKISGHRDISILQNTYYAPDMAQVANLLG